MLYEMKNPTASAAGSLQDINVLHPNTAQKLRRSQASALPLYNSNASNTFNTCHDAHKSLTRLACSEYEEGVFYKQRELVEYLKANGVSSDDPLFTCGTPDKQNPKFIFKCGQSYCPLCSQRKFLQKVPLYHLIDDELLNDIGLVSFMVTISFPDQEAQDILPFYERLQGNFAALSRNRKFKKTIVGYIRATELSMGDADQYHIHFHVLCLFDAENPQVPIVSAAGKKARLVRVMPSLQANGKTTAPFLERLFKRFLGNCKVFVSKKFETITSQIFFLYVSKMPDIPPDAWLAWKSAIFGKRLVTLGGLFLQAMQYAVKIQKKRRVCYAG